MLNRPGKFRGMFTSPSTGVDLIKSLVTGEKRYIPRIGQKQLRISWNTRTKAEVYANMVLVRYEKKIAVLLAAQTELQQLQENQSG